MGKSWQKTCKVLDNKQISTRQPKNAFQMLKWCFVLILDQVNTRHVENKGHYETLDMQVLECDGL
jgi:hypothetical protein